jgi:hypothetical protein
MRIVVMLILGCALWISVMRSVRAAATLPVGIAAVSGDVECVAPPASVRRQVFESDEFVRVFLEREFTAATVPINASEPGIYNAYADFDDQLVPVSGKVRSYFLHFDPVGTDLSQLKGTITFNQPIVGVIGRSLTLEETDASFGAPGTLYPTDRFNREPEYWDRGTYDFFEIGSDWRTLSFRWEVTTDIDQLRVVTAVPEPGVAAMAGCAGLLFFRGRNRR